MLKSKNKFKLKKWFKYYDIDEEYIIDVLNSALRYCESAILVHNENGTLEFFDYDYNHGICYNLTTFLESIVTPLKYNENILFINELIADMFSSYSNYSGERHYPIKSNDQEKTNFKFYHQKNKYTPELCEIRLEFIKECKEYLNKL